MQYPDEELAKKIRGGDEFTERNLEFAENMANDPRFQELIKEKEKSNDDVDTKKDETKA